MDSYFRREEMTNKQMENLNTEEVQNKTIVNRVYYLLSCPKLFKMISSRLWDLQKKYLNAQVFKLEQ
jgi:glucose-6-phosphate 1-dehydrogenase